MVRSDGTQLTAKPSTLRWRHGFNSQQRQTIPVDIGHVAVYAIRMERKEPSMIGLSLSLCVAEILNDRVRLEDVKLIRSNILARDDAEWDYVIGSYCHSYWRRDPARAREIVQTLRETHRIQQPRLTGDPWSRHAITDGIWITDPAG